MAFYDAAVVAIRHGTVQELEDLAAAEPKILVQTDLRGDTLVTICIKANERVKLMKCLQLLRIAQQTG